MLSVQAVVTGTQLLKHLFSRRIVVGVDLIFMPDKARIPHNSMHSTHNSVADGVKLATGAAQAGTGAATANDEASHT